MTSGEALRSMRSQSGISMRDVEESSRIIAEKEGCAEYFVSTAWLTQLENTDSTPSIYKIFTLSMVYGVTYAEILRLYGVDVDKPTLRQLSAPPRETRLVDSKIHSELLTVEFPVRFDPGFRVEHTNMGTNSSHFSAEYGNEKFRLWIHWDRGLHAIPDAEAWLIRTNRYAPNESSSSTV
jgi:transcriptional regulator with XRE-family HTH domain